MKLVHWSLMGELSIIWQSEVFTVYEDQ